MHIGFVVWSLCIVKGGIERLGVTLANEMVYRGHSVALFHQDMRPGNHAPVYSLDSNVHVINLRLFDLHSIKNARLLLENQNIDVLCALFSWDALLWFPAILNNTDIPLLISEHNHPQIIENERWNHYERRACLAAADKIHLLNNNFRDMLPFFLRERAVVIPNPVDPPCAQVPIKARNKCKRILSIGRMQEDSKQFSLLIHAFRLLSNDFPDWELYVCGDGESRSNYLKLVKELGLQDRVRLPGRVENVDDYYASSDIFCIPSRYEGFGLVTVEAQRHGLPVVGFAGCSGTNEIIVHEKNGLLASKMTAHSLAENLRPLMFSPSLRQKMGSRGQQMLDRYKKENIIDRWESLLRETARYIGKTQLKYPPLTEKQRTENALAEILNREMPFQRPACTDLQRVLRKQQVMLNKAFKLLEKNGVLKQEETS